MIKYERQNTKKEKKKIPKETQFHQKRNEMEWNELLLISFITFHEDSGSQEFKILIQATSNNGKEKKAMKFETCQLQHRSNRA